MDRDIINVIATVTALAIPAVCFGMWQQSAWAGGFMFAVLFYWNYSK